MPTSIHVVGAAYWKLQPPTLRIELSQVLAKFLLPYNYCRWLPFPDLKPVNSQECKEAKHRKIVLNAALKEIS